MQVSAGDQRNCHGSRNTNVGPARSLWQEPEIEREDGLNVQYSIENGKGKVVLLLLRLCGISVHERERNVGTFQPIEG